MPSRRIQNDPLPISRPMTRRRSPCPCLGDPQSTQAAPLAFKSSTVIHCGSWPNGISGAERVGASCPRSILNSRIRTFSASVTRFICDPNVLGTQSSLSFDRAIHCGASHAPSSGHPRRSPVLPPPTLSSTPQISSGRARHWSFRRLASSHGSHFNYRIVKWIAWGSGRPGATPGTVPSGSS